MADALDSFEEAAEAFHKVTGNLMPGKDGCPRDEEGNLLPEVARDHRVWCAAIQYMHRETGTLQELERELSQAKADLAKAQTEVGRLNIEAEGQAVLLRIRDASITKMKHEAAMEKNFNDTVKDSLREGQAELLSRAEAAEAALSAIRQTDGKAREVVKDLLGMNPDAGERIWFETAQRLMGENTDLKARAEAAEALVGSINRERDALEEQKFAAMKDQIAKMLDLNKNMEAALGERERVLEKIAGGHVEPGVVTDALLMAGKAAFQERMFTWCQETARKALTPPQSEKPKAEYDCLNADPSSEEPCGECGPCEKAKSAKGGQ